MQSVVRCNQWSDATSGQMLVSPAVFDIQLQRETRKECQCENFYVTAYVRLSTLPGLNATTLSWRPWRVPPKWLHSDITKNVSGGVNNLIQLLAALSAPHMGAPRDICKLSCHAIYTKTVCTTTDNAAKHKCCVWIDEWFGPRTHRLLTSSVYSSTFSELLVTKACKLDAKQKQSVT